MLLNVDLGEEITNDLQIEKRLMPYIDLCNIACGAHAGNDKTIRETILLADQNNVKIGAHPSFPDRINFGRKEMVISNSLLKTTIIEQIKKVQSISTTLNIPLHHIKFHGALYHSAAYNKKIALLVIKILLDHFPDLHLILPPKSDLLSLAKKNKVKYLVESFGDRTYNDDLRLVNRSQENAVLHDYDSIHKQVKHIVEKKKIPCQSGKNIAIEIDTICMHSDKLGSVENIIALSNYLKNI